MPPSSSRGRPPHVLILGGGYVAITLAPKLREAIRSGELSATVVSRTNFQMFHGFTGEMLTGRIGPGHTLSAARRVFRPAGVHVAEIENIDLERKLVTTSRRLDGARFELPYDHVVLALGTSDNFTAYPGLAEHSFKLKTFDDCFRLRNHILTMLELADIDEDPEERRRLLTFFIAGGGFAGVEIAGELSDWITGLTNREYSTIQRDECRVVLVHPGKTILPELATGGGHDRLIGYARRHLARLGVEVMTETRVAATTPNEVYLNDGTHVPTRTIVAAIGAKPPSLFDNLDVPRERGRVRTDEYLRVDGFEEVWAAGDCAAIPDGDGGWCPPVGAYALKEGITAGENIVRSVTHRPLEAFRYSGLGQAGSLGRRTAVGEFKGREMTGLAAWLIWRCRLLYYVPSWDRRLWMLTAWLLAPLIGRDIVEMSTIDPGDYEVRHNIFQPGETVVHHRRAARYVHVIVEGDVDIVGNGDGGKEHVIRAMHPGDHFDQKRLDRFSAERAIARTVVRTVSLRAEQADRLQEVLQSAGRLVAWSGEMPAIDPNFQRPPGG